LSTDAKHAFVTAMERSHGRRIHRFLSQRLAHGRSEAPDLVQEVFLRLLRVEDYEAIRNPQAYLYTIANHVLFQHRLRNAATLQATPFDGLVDQFYADQEEVDPAIQLEVEQRFVALGKALEAYSPRAYTTLILHRCDGIPLRQIAPRLGVSYTMVKRYLAQALAFCQRTLDETESLE
jgi:RNA polymerase sigma factor (sigma-70 family)